MWKLPNYPGLPPESLATRKRLLYITYPAHGDRDGCGSALRRRGGVMKHPRLSLCHVHLGFPRKTRTQFCLPCCVRARLRPFVRPPDADVPRDPNEEFARNEICKLSNKLITPSLSDRANATGEVDGAGDHLSRVYDEA